MATQEQTDRNAGPDRASPARRILTWIGVAALLIAIAAGVAAKTDVYFDDVFITLAYSRNMVEGRGMVFQAGERVLGTTTPLWCWVNAVGFLVAPPDACAAAACRFLFLATLVGAGLALVRFVRRLGWGWWGVFGAAGLMLTPEVVWLFGTETFLAIWLALELLIALMAGRAALMGVLGALLILTRPDAALLVALALAVQFLLPKARSRVLRSVACLALALAPALIFFQIYYGSPLPNTLAAKQAQLAHKETVVWAQSMFQGLGAFLRARVLDAPLFMSLLPLLGIVWIAFEVSKTLWSRHGKPTPRLAALALFVVWPWLHVGALEALGVSYYPWYLYPFWLFEAFLFAAGLASLWKTVEATARRAKAAGAVRCAAATLIVFLIALVAWHWAQPWRGDPAAWQRGRHDGYRRIARELGRRASEDGDNEVLAYEIGVVRFYAPPRVHILDQAFLVQKIEDDSAIYNPVQMVYQRRPRFILETHPNLDKLSREDRLAVMARRRPDFCISFPLPGDDALDYRPVQSVQNCYGMHILFERDDAD